MCAILESMVARGTVDMQEPIADESTFELVMDQLEELVATLIDEIRERPGIVLAIAAGVIGAIVGSRLATGASHGRGMAPRPVTHKARQVGQLAELAGLG